MIQSSIFAVMMPMLPCIERGLPEHPHARPASRLGKDGANGAGLHERSPCLARGIAPGVQSCCQSAWLQAGSEVPRAVQHCGHSLPKIPSSTGDGAGYIVQWVHLCRGVLFKAGKLTGFPHKTVMQLIHEKKIIKSQFSPK